MITVVEKVNSRIDAVTKYVLSDNTFGKNEVSIIRKADKIIFCIPTQTNCKMGCTFCHLTGTTRKAQNLTVEWLVNVVDFLVTAEYDCNGHKDLLISFMGVGEPLLNMKSLIGCMAALNAKYDRIRFGISTMMPNVSAITELIQWSLENPTCRVKLHLSVHGIFNRHEFVKSIVNISDAIALVQDFHQVTQNPIEYHYTLVNGVNDGVDELNEFNSIITGDGSTVKFLTLSETNGYKNSLISQACIRALFPNNVVEFYNPPGRDVGASCGMFDIELYNEQ